MIYLKMNLESIKEEINQILSVKENGFEKEVFYRMYCRISEYESPLLVWKYFASAISDIVQGENIENLRRTVRFLEDNPVVVSLITSDLPQIRKDELLNDYTKGLPDFDLIGSLNKRAAALFENYYLYIKLREPIGGYETLIDWYNHNIIFPSVGIGERWGLRMSSRIQSSANMERFREWSKLECTHNEKARADKAAMKEYISAKMTAILNVNDKTVNNNEIIKRNLREIEEIERFKLFSTEFQAALTSVNPVDSIQRLSSSGVEFRTVGLGDNTKEPVFFDKELISVLYSNYRIESVEDIRRAFWEERIWKNKDNKDFHESEEVAESVRLQMALANFLCLPESELNKKIDEYRAEIRKWSN